MIHWKKVIAFTGLTIVISLKVWEEYYVNSMQSKITQLNNEMGEYRIALIDYANASSRAEDTILVKDKYNPQFYLGRRGADLTYQLRAVINIYVFHKRFLGETEGLDSIANVMYNKLGDYEARNDINGLELYIQDINRQSNSIGIAAQSNQRELVISLTEEKNLYKSLLTAGQIIGLVLAFIEKFIPDKKPEFIGSVKPESPRQPNRQDKKVSRQDRRKAEREARA